MKTILSLLVAVVVIVAMVIFTYVKYHNMGVTYEQKIEAVWENNQNVLGQYTTKIMEMAQVNTMYKDDIKEIYEGVMSGRYGDDGSQAMWQWLQEQNPNIDPNIYLKLQQTMEAGRNEFAVEQTKLVDVKREYRSQLKFVWSGFWLEFAGYPTINVGHPNKEIDDYRPIISSSAKESFETGIDDGVKLR